MLVAVRCGLALALLASPAFPSGKSRTIQAIDAYCNALDDSLAAATPFFFSGPAPWAELDDFPEGVPDPAFAYVYTVGPDVRKVLLRVAGPEEDWLEDITYFFLGDGSLARLNRRFRQPAANIVLDEVSYFAHGRRIKDSTHRHAFRAGKPDLSQLNDPGAPVFWTVDELPFRDMLNSWRQLT